MRPVQQTKYGGPSAAPHERGNCFVSCLASILELPLQELPDVCADNDGGWDAILDWLYERGLYLLWVQPPKEPDEYWPGYTIAGVASAFQEIRDATDGGGHVVVALNGQPVWNPNPRDTRPLDTLEVDTYYMLYPTDPARWFADRQHLAEDYKGLPPSPALPARGSGNIPVPPPSLPDVEEV